MSLSKGEMLLYGAGGHARVVISILRAMRCEPVGVFDDDPAKSYVADVAVRGPYSPGFRAELPMLVAVGDNAIRCQLTRKISHSFGTAIHPSAIVDPSATAGEGTVVVHRAVVQANVTLGRHVIVNTAASVDHDCQLGDFVQVAPGAILCGNVRVGEGALIAAGAVVVPGITIGRWAVVGAGTVVTRPIPDGAVVWGCSARVIRFRES